MKKRQTKKKVIRKRAKKNVTDAWLKKNKLEVSDDQAAFKKKQIRPIYLKMKTGINRNADLRDQEFDFKEIRNAVDVESILRQAREKYIQLMWKNGYNLVGKNQEAVSYIRTRLAQIALVTGIPTNIFLRNISEEMITYHNVFIVKERNVISSGGKPYVDSFGRRRLPIAGMFTIPASHVAPELSTDSSPRVIGWRIEDVKDIEEQSYKSDDIFHMYMSKVPGNHVGTPAIVPVMDDIRALRKAEENAEILVYQHAIPLYQYTIGTKEAPVEDIEEFEGIKSSIEGMDPQGMFVVPHDHSIVAVGSGDSPLDVEKYLKYFRLRVISGLGLSSVVFGEGDSSNRNTATVLDRSLQDGAKEYLSNIKTFFNEHIIKELLLEGDYDIMDPEDEVKLFTPEIDIDTKNKKEEHIMAMYHGNCITEDEMREGLGREKINDEMRPYMYFNLVEQPRALIGSGDERFTPEGGYGVNIPKRGANKIRPKNQHGVKTNSKPAVNSSASYIVTATRNAYGNVSKIYNSVSLTLAKEIPVIDKAVPMKRRFQSVTDAMYNDSNSIIVDTFTEGASTISEKAVGTKQKELKSLMQRYKERLHKLGTDATILLEDLQAKKINPSLKDTSSRNTIKSDDIITVFDSLQYDLVDTVTETIKKAYNLGKAIAGGKPFRIKDSTGECRHNEEMVREINIDLIPPHSSRCQCEIDIRSENG